MFKKDIYQGNYSGEVRNDLAHGFGKIEFKDGSKLYITKSYINE